MIKKNSINRWLLRATVLTVLAVLFFQPMAALALYAARSDVNSHVFLVPLITVYLIYVRRNHLPSRSKPCPGVGIPILIAGLLLWGAMILHYPPSLTEADRLTLFAIAFVLCLWGVGFLFLGRAWMKAIAFPAFFLMLSAPLPPGIINTVETWLKSASSDASELFLTISGTPMLRDGNVFQLPGITIEVAQECSGIRSSYVLILTSLLAASLFLTRTWTRAALVLFAIPLGIIRNGFRVWVISMLCIHIGPEMIHSIIHKRGGPLFFALSLIPLFGAVWWLRKMETRQIHRRSIRDGVDVDKIDIEPSLETKPVANQTNA